MQIVQAPRASAILYNLITHQGNSNPWLLPANICPIVPITFLKARVPFAFVDISQLTLHMDLDRAEDLVRSGRFAGLLYAHTYGEESTPNDFFACVKDISPGLLLIDDRCLCLPDLAFNPSSKAEVQLYSTGYAKVVDLHVGGYAFLSGKVSYQPARLTFDPEHQEEIEKSYKEAVRRRERYVYQDCNWLDTESAIPVWDEYSDQIRQELKRSLAHRQTLNEIYTSRLPEEIQFPPAFQAWRFNLRVREKQRILQAIFSSGLFASSHYASLAGIMEEGSAPQAEALAGQVINLFNDHHFTVDQAEQVCNIVLEHLS